MRLATCLSSLQCTPLQPSSHLFHYETTLPLSTVRRTNTADRTPGGGCHCPVMAHAQLYFSNGARVIGLQYLSAHLRFGERPDFQSHQSLSWGSKVSVIPWTEAPVSLQAHPLSHLRSRLSTEVRMTKAENKDSTTSATAHPPHLATIHELKEELFDSHQRYYELATANRELSQKLRTAEKRITEEIHL
ncbi:hypothetical protein C8J57DRAFT_1732056 [Mycena rebaudengoi]|nr:hypothetical protein C8J57DRAFT_1732056 [Mycena rebaudengoi]